MYMLLDTYGAKTCNTNVFLQKRWSCPQVMERESHTTLAELGAGTHGFQSLVVVIIMY
jgi:hypothetical protein